MTTPPGSGPVPAPDSEPMPREIWFLVVASFIVAMGYGLVAPVLPTYARSFGVGVTAATVVVSAFAFMRLVFAPVGGSLVGRLGPRVVYVTGLVVVALSTGASAFAGDYWQLLTFRGLGGIGSTMFTISAASLVIALAPVAKRGRASALFGSGFLLGNVLGPVLGAALSGLGLRAPFIIYGVGLLVAAALVAVFVRPSRAAREAAKARVDAPPTQPPMRVAEAMRDPAYRASLVSGFTHGWANMGVRMAIIPLFVVTVAGAGDWSPGVALASYAIGTLVTLRWSGRAIDRVGRRPLLMGGLAFSALTALLLGLSFHVVMVLVLCVLGGVAAAAIQPAQQAVLADVVGRERSGGPVVARSQMAMDTGTILGPIVSGVLVDSVGYAWAFGVAGVILLVGLLPWRTAPETLERTRPDHP
ncbi:MFS transporter [Georgenia sp. Z1491]|uniref:MFS transporter n=1 Tax=Georgenia sp. Z1491 TaxID=3416707 RepID=UPI003CF83860